MLKLHGYKLQPLNKENINQKVEKTNTDSITVYTIDEPSIREILGESINETQKPIRTLFDNSMLSYLKAPVLIVVVSDAFYGETGLQSYAQSLSADNHGGNSANNHRNATVKKESNRATVVSLYLAAIAFIASGINSVFGSFLTFSASPYTTYTILPGIILIVSIAAIVGRAISIRNERNSSVPLVIASIVFFITLTVLGAFAGYLPGFISGAIAETENNVSNIFPLPYYPSMAEFVVIGLLFAVGMLRYVFYLGRGSGKAAYGMTIFGVAWMAFIIMMNFIYAYSPAIFPAFLGTSGVSQLFPTISFDLPLFGFNYVVSSVAIPQYMVPINDLVLIGNLIMATGLLLAAKSQRAGWDLSHKTNESAGKSSA